VDSSNNIICQTAVFEESKWSKLIVKTGEAINEILATTFVGDVWRQFLDLDATISVTDWRNLDVKLVLYQDNRNQIIDLDTIIVAQEPSYDDSLDFQRLCSYFELCLQGFRFGVGRYLETMYLPLSCSYIFGQCLYYNGLSKKKGSVIGRKQSQEINVCSFKKTDLVEHRIASLNPKIIYTLLSPGLVS